MKPGRLLRDVIVLSVFCGCFYLLTINNGSGKGEKDFSPARLRADEYVKDQDWMAAAKEFETLTEADPYNGRAWFMLASSYYYTANELLVKRNRLLSGDSNPTDPDIKKMDEEIRAHEKKATEVYIQAKEFARFRNSSLLRLAVMECRARNFELTMDYLQEFVEFDGYTVAGLFKYREFGTGGIEMCNPETTKKPETRLHSEKRFWEICVLEEINR